MSGLRERLNRFKKPEADRVSAPAAQASAGEDWAKLGAHLETSEWGDFILRRRVYSLDSRHGKYRLAELAVCAGELSRFHEAADARLERLLFFDTETTGLGVGAGNVPFMVGIGYYSDDGFVVEQLFMRNPSEELAMLRYLQEKLSRYTHIVSYNGRSFDWPILKNRYVLNRLGLEDSSLLQLDLLYPARSLWKNCLPSCRLSQVEASVLGFTRVGDVPGSMAPALYFQYLVEKDAELLQGLFTHNEHDIVSLAALAIHFGKLLSGEGLVAAASQGSGAGLTLGEIDHAVAVDRDIIFSGDHDQAAEDDQNDSAGAGSHPSSAYRSSMEAEEGFRIGVWLDRMGCSELAETVFEQVRTDMVQNQSHSDQTAEVMLLLAAFYKKKGVYVRASELWLRHIERKNNGIALNLEPYIELAMYYEHREKDIRQALFYAEEAWTRLWRRRSLSRVDRKQSELEQSIQRRMERLNTKLQQLQTKAAKADKKGRNSLSLDAAAEAHYASGTANVRGHHAAASRSRKARHNKPMYVMDSLI